MWYNGVIIIFFILYTLVHYVNVVNGQGPLYGPYMGTACQGVFDGIPINMSNPVTSSYVIDTKVNETINQLYTQSIWLKQACVSSFREHTCMLMLSNITSSQVKSGHYSVQLYCQSNCLNLGEGCDGFISTLQEVYPDAIEQIFAPCQLLPNEKPPYCFTGSDSTIQEKEP